MSWTKFKFSIIKKMQKGVASYEDLAKILANEYDRAVKHISSGDKVSRNRLQRGNKEALEKYIVSVFKAQSKSTIPLDIPNLLAKGFVIYWSGGIMTTDKIPPPPSPGAITNLKVVENTVLNPGTPVSIPFPLGKSQTTEQWVNNLIRLLKLHLTTINGKASLISAYPSPLPPGFTQGPGINLWTGYDILDT